MPRISCAAFEQAAYRIWPGAALALILAIVSHRIVGVWLPVSSLLIAIVIGITLRTLGWVPGWGEPGLKWAAKFPLRLGIVLLGLQLAVGDILGLGWQVLLIVGVTVLVTFIGMRALGPLVGADRTTTALLATGTSICGASAVAAATSVLDRGEGKDRGGRPLEPAAATALAIVTLYGTVVMFALPLVADLLGLSQVQAGVWIGASVHEVGQVVAAGGLVGATALAVATLVKLARVLFLAPIVIALRIGDSRASGNVSNRRPPLLPWFVLGFMATVGLNSMVHVPEGTADFIAQITTMLMTVAMVGIGAAVNLRDLRSTGASAVLLGGLGSLIAAIVALTGVSLLM